MKLWAPDFSKPNNIATFIENYGKAEVSNYPELYADSISDINYFWKKVAERVCWQHPYSEAFVGDADKMLNGKWFEGGRINFAENLLFPKESGDIAISAHLEGIDGKVEISWDTLRSQVRAAAFWLRETGVKKGDRVAAVSSNSPEAIVAMLAATSIGAIWSSCSPDFGESGILERFVQISPKVLFYTKKYHYGGKVFLCEETATAVQKKLGCRLVFWDHIDHGEEFDDIVSKPVSDITFEPTRFSEPLYILFSSGTTGKPKCIVHSCGGTLLQHHKELSLHCDLKPQESILYFTTCGWMMWNWLVSSLCIGATVHTYDGSVSAPEVDQLWRAAESVDVFGTSPKFLSYSKSKCLTPKGKMRLMLSTGAPLLEEHFEWVYQKFPNVQLGSISGGTDIVSCFALSNPCLPVYSGELQGAGLGMAVEAWDERGVRVKDKKGELVCTRPFPSMPVGFWGDDGSKFRESYFDKYEKEVWTHGDYISENSQTGGITIYGRSDTTLNPGGVRIGTAEIYRQLEKITEIEDSLAIGVPENGDISVVFFVKSEVSLDKLTEKIMTLIKKELTPRHLPRWIFPVNAIPYTRSGKKIEKAIAGLFKGETVENESAVANVDCLVEYENYAKSFILGEWSK